MFNKWLIGVVLINLAIFSAMLAVCTGALTAILLLADTEDGGTEYTAIARHRSAEKAKQHADMGFFEGWGTVVT